MPGARSEQVPLRISADQKAALALVARIDQTSQAEVLRQALAAHLAARHADPRFRAALHRSFREEVETLDRLAENT